MFTDNRGDGNDNISYIYKKNLCLIKQAFGKCLDVLGSDGKKLGLLGNYICSKMRGRSFIKSLDLLRMVKSTTTIYTNCEAFFFSLHVKCSVHSV